MKEWKCLMVADHDNLGKVITLWEKGGWRLHTYTCAGNAQTMSMNHYLLFVKGE